MQLADRSGHERNQDVDRQFMYHKHWLPAIAAQFKADHRLSSTDDAIAETLEALDDEHPISSPVALLYRLVCFW